MSLAITATIDMGDMGPRIHAMVEKKLAKITERIVRLAAQNARQYAGNRTTGTSYSGEVHGGLRGELSAHPRSEGAAINLAIAIRGRKAYTIYKPKPRIMIDPQSGPPTFVAHKTSHKAIQGDDFMNKAMRNAVQRVRNDYR